MSDDRNRKKNMLIVTHFDKNYFEWTKIFFESLQKLHPACEVIASGVNLTDDQINLMRNYKLNINLENKYIEFDGIQERRDGGGDDAKWKVMMQCRVSQVALDASSETNEDIMVVMNADMFFRKSLSSLVEEAYNHDILLHLIDDHMSHNQIQNGVMVFNLNNPKVKDFLKYYNKMWDKNTYPDVYHYLDQNHLFKAYNEFKDKLNIGKLNSLYIDGTFNNDAYIWSAHSGNRDLNYVRFVNEKKRNFEHE